MPNSSNNKRSKKAIPRKTNNAEKIEKRDIKNKESKKGNKKKKTHAKLKLILKILLVLFLLACVAGAGIIAAMFFGLFGEEFDISKEELIIGTSNTIILDKDGNEIANLSDDEKRKIISLSEMSEYLPKAYVAIEDKRFYEHNGVDIKRTAGAILGVITRNSSYGGSSITQQLVKNVTNDKERSGIAGITRKVTIFNYCIHILRSTETINSNF